MPFTAVFLDVTHREGEDNLLYATKTHDDTLLGLRGMLAASAGACRTLFHECIAQASLTPDLHAAYVDDGDVLLVLLHSSSTWLATTPVMSEFVQRSMRVIRAACGPRGPKLSKWLHSRLDDIFDSLFRRFDHDVAECAMHVLFPHSVPSTQLPFDTLTTFHGILASSAPLDPSCVGRVLFWRSKLVYSELDTSHTALVFECFTTICAGHAQFHGSIYVDGDSHSLVILGSSSGDPGWSLCVLSRCATDAASATADPAAAHISVHEAITTALPQPHATFSSHVGAVAYDVVARSVLSDITSLDASQARVFFRTVARMRTEFVYAQTMHDILHADVVDQPHHPVKAGTDLLHLNEANEFGADEGDACLLSSRWSRFRPDPILCHAITQATTRVHLDDRDLWIIGHRYAAYELYACLDASETPPSSMMEIVQNAWDELVAVQPTTGRGPS